MDNVSKLISWGHWFSFINILFALVIATRYLVAADWPPSLLGQGYMLVSWLGHFSFLGFAFYLLLIFPISFLVPNEKAMRLIAVFIATVGTTTLLLDTQSFTLFNFHLNPLVWNYLFGGEGPQATNLLFIAIPFIFLLQLTASGLIWRNLKTLHQKKLGPVIATSLFVAFLLTHTIHIWADASYYRPITMQKANFPLSYPMTAKTFLIRHGWMQQNEQEKSNRHTHPGREIKYPLRAIEVNQPQPKMNVLLVMIDALRADMLNPTNMPALSQFAGSASTFNHHFSGSNHARLGIFTTFYGLPSQYWPDISDAYTPPILMTQLQQAGYQFGLFSGQGFLQPEHMQTSFNSIEQLNMAEPISPVYDGDTQAVKQWQQWLNQQNNNGAPWFSYLYLNTPTGMEVPPEFDGPHQPTSTMLQAQQAGPESLIKGLFNDYQNAVLFTDQQLNRVFTTLAQLSALENTIVIVTSAHGQEFDDTGNNNWGHQSNYAWAQTQVPLVIHWPGKTPIQVDKDTSHLDIVPTLMQGLFETTTASRYYTSGLNLFGPLKRDFILLGDEENYVVYQADRITEFTPKGNAYVLDRNYHELENAEPDIQVLMKVLNELRRFYPNN
ncbi:DUF3413 domain-containing protein [Motilimonas pumila]|nr:DUF3413 domain-containing protein [Motilimonas pumila]